MSKKLDIQALLQSSFKKFSEHQDNPLESTNKIESGPSTPSISGKGKAKEKGKAKSNKQRKDVEKTPKPRSKSTKKIKPKEKEDVVLSEKTWHLDKDRQVSLKKFHGKMIVDIREFYVDKLSREMTPGKKGIALTLEQLKAFKSLLPQLDEELPSFSSSSAKEHFDPLA